MSSLVDVLFRHDGLVHTVATHAAQQAAIAQHQVQQAEGITKFLTDEHYPSLVEEVWALRRVLEKMPSQLYLQSVAMNELVWIVAEECSIYFSQRRPRELAKFEWVIDAKDKNITTQEKWWRDVIGPLGESRSRRQPFIFVQDKGFDYSHFDRAFLKQKCATRIGRRSISTE